MTQRAQMALHTIWEGCAAYTRAGALMGGTPAVGWFATGAAYEALNGVFAGPSVNRAPGVRDVADAVSAFRRWNVPALWHIGSTLHERPPTPPPGLQPYETEPLMVARIGRYSAPRVPGLRIVRVSDVADIQTWVQVWTGQRPSRNLEHTTQLRFGARPGFTHLLALLDGRPVGCAAGFVGQYAGEIQHIVTVPRMRRRGIGTALTVAALRALDDRGARIAVLTSSPDGERIYHNLGFRRVGMVRRYLWSPMDGHDPLLITQSDAGRNDRAPLSDVTR